MRMITITSISISNSKESHYALTRMIVSSHKITNAPCQGGVVTISNNTQKYHARVQNACLQVYACGGALFEGCLFLQNPILRNIQITHISKTVQKVVPNIFEINLKIN